MDKQEREYVFKQVAKTIKKMKEKYDRLSTLRVIRKSG
jgi:hypothetical protein